MPAGGLRREHGVRLQRQLVVRDVRRLQRDRALDVVFGHRQGLFRQRVHQVEVEIVEAGILRELHRRLGLAAVVDAAEALQATVVETLDAEAQPIHARRAITLEAAMLGGAGIGFQGDFEAGREAQPGAGLLQERVDRFRREQRGRAAAEEHRLHGATPRQRQVDVEVGNQGVDIRRERQGATLFMRIEVAVRTFAHAPRQVHVQRQRRGGRASATL